MTDLNARSASTPLFSVIIPTYDRRPFLEEALATVWAQRFRDFEVIVVDDGSTDGTLAFLESVRPPIAVETQANAGPGAARNRGARHARGSYLAFLDSDDLWFPWTLEITAKLIETHRRPALVCAELVDFTDIGELHSIREAPAKERYYDDYLASFAEPYFVGAGMTVVRRDVFERAGGFNPGRISCEDHDFALRIGSEKGFVKVLAPQTIAWRHHSAGASLHTERLCEGAQLLMDQERKGIYPGGARRRRQRLHILTRHLRSVALQLARQGALAQGWRLYLRTLPWNLALGRARYLLFYPVVMLKSLMARVGPR